MIERLLYAIEEPHQTDCLRFMEKYSNLFNTSMGSAAKHQAWPGGYRDHITEVMDICQKLYFSLSEIRPLPFSLSDAMFVCFLHDIEKIWCRAVKTEDRVSVDKDEILETYFKLNDEHRHAIKYIHGEGSDYHPTKRIQSPLAAFVHIADTVSARIWYNEPKRES